MGTLRRKILLGYMVASVLAAAALGLAVLNLVRLGSASDAILKENYRSILAAEEMLHALDRQDRKCLRLILGDGTEGASPFRETEQTFATWLSRAKANVTIPGEPEILRRIDQSYAEYLDRLAHFRGTSFSDRDRGFAVYREQLEPQAAAVRRACWELHELNRVTMEAGSRRARRVSQTAMWSVIVSGVVSLAGIIAFSVWSADRIVRPLDRLAQVTEQVAAGDYDARVEVATEDEIGRLAEKFNAMVATLRAYRELHLQHLLGEQRKAEAILEAIDDGVVVVGADGAVTGLNPAAARILSVPQTTERRRPLAEVVADEELREQIVRALAAGRPPPAKEKEHLLTLVGEGRGARYFEWAITPIARSPQEPTGAIVLLRDVTRLKTLDQLKTEFVMTASHELRSPLTAIAMSIGLLEERAKDTLAEADRRLLDVGQEELGRLRRLVEELLDLSKIESGKFEVTLTKTSVAAFLEAALAPFRPQAEQKGIALSLEAANDLPPVQADPHKIAWVTANLVGNALRYARSEICVSAERAGKWVYIYVRDDGPGIPYEHQSRIFDKFVQIAGDAQGGAGLGLAIAKEIVRAHHGHLWVESEPSRGSLFIVALPTGP